MAKKDNAGRHGNRYGGVIAKFMTLLLLGTLAVGADAYVTLKAVQGTWQMTMSDESAQHLTTLMNAGVENATGRKTLRDTLRDQVVRGLGRLSGTVLKSAANQIQISVEGGDFALRDEQSAMAASMLSTLAAQSGRETVECNKGSILAFFPLMKVTCENESGRTAIWFWMRGFPDTQMSLFPVPVGKEELQKHAQRLQEKADGAATIDATTLEAIREVFTIHLNKVS